MGFLLFAHLFVFFLMLFLMRDCFRILSPSGVLCISTSKV